jgi:hypothetical protein
MATSHVKVAATPVFKLHAKVAPVDVQLASEGCFSISTGHIRARCEEFPIVLTIPFLRRRRGRVVAAVLGPFGVHIEPFEAHLRATDVSISGVIGKHGLEGNLEGSGSGELAIDLTGNIPVKAAKAAAQGLMED